MTAWLEWMPLTEVVPESTSASPSPYVKPSSGHFSAEVGTDDMLLGRGTLALLGGIQLTWKKLSGPHPCVVELSGS